MSKLSTSEFGRAVAIALSGFVCKFTTVYTFHAFLRMSNIDFLRIVFYINFSCWLSVQDGLIWAFIGPMLTIVVVCIN